MQSSLSFQAFLFLLVNTTAFSSDGSETEVKVQFHSQTQENQPYAESETGETDNRQMSVGDKMMASYH